MSTPRKRLSLAARAQRGMTLLEIMIVLAILALVMGLLVGPRVMKLFGESKVSLTKLKLTKYANEAFPSWSMAHPDKACPDKLTDLNEYMDAKDANDAWSRPLKMFCGPSLPAGARGLAVMSLGEDGKEGGEGDAADLKSWE